MRTLILVDIQNDFLPGGPLAVPDGEAVVEVANRLMSKYDLVVATQDWHPVNHFSFASQHSGCAVGDQIVLDGLEQILWPDHCVQGSEGAELAGQLDVSAIDHVVQKGTDRNIDSYSGFFDNARRKSTGLDAYLREVGASELHVLGLATDYCVKFTVLDAQDLGYETTLITDGVRGIDLSEGDCDRAIKAMRLANVRLVTSLEIS